MMSDADDHWSDGLPEMARIRAHEYHLSYGVPKSQARAAAMRDLGYQNKEIAETLDVSPDAASSYYSKFNLDLVNETVRLTLAAFGGPKRVLGWNMMQDEDDDKEYWYALKPISDEQDIADSQIHSASGEFVLVKVRADDRTFAADSTVYESLDAMADDIYREAEFDDERTAQEVHGLLTETGLAMDALEDPRTKAN